MASLIEKRYSLHKKVAEQEEHIEELQAQLTQIQHLANIGTISHMIAHEMNNLLTPVRSYGSLALHHPDDADLAQKALGKAVKNSERACAVMESMLALADGEDQEKEEVLLKDIVEDVFTCLCRDLSKDGITVDVQIPAELSLWCVPIQIQQVLMNLILNARHALAEGGGHLITRAEQEYDTTRIQVIDTGSGIPAEHMQRIFETFYTTRNGDGCTSRSGSGLGLAFCRSVVGAHGGTITVESEPGKGTTFTITLPTSASDDA